MCTAMWPALWLRLARQWAELWQPALTRKANVTLATLFGVGESDVHTDHCVTLLLAAPFLAGCACTRLGPRPPIAKTPSKREGQIHRVFIGIELGPSKRASLLTAGCSTLHATENIHEQIR